MLENFKKNDNIKWYEWCDETFKLAQKQNKAIFIFIGYELCGLCDDMQRDVLLNKECLSILNQDFISIYIDKDKRDDLDRYFQNVHQLLNKKAGGWPACIFCTPQNRPFYARTYIPLESKENSIEEIGFLELIKLINSKIKSLDDKLFENAKEVERFLQKQDKPSEATVLKNDFVKNFMLQVKNNYDAKNGGFGKSPKFLHLNIINTLLDIDAMFDNSEAKEMILHTLDAMQNSKIHDVQNGGFYRYSISEDWQRPQLEKTLQDNALLCEIYTKAYKIYNNKAYLNTAKKCADFWCENMSKNGLFYSSSYSKDNTTLIDKKIKTSYSSMMIKSLFILAQNDNKYKDIAQNSLKSLLDAVYIKDNLYHFSYIEKTSDTKAFLDDYAFLALALMQAYETTKDELYLINAQRFTNYALELFYKNAKWVFTDGEYTTKSDASDKNSTSSISAMIDVMLKLGTNLNDDKYIHFAFKTLEYNSYTLARQPLYYSSLLAQMFKYLQTNPIKV